LRQLGLLVGRQNLHNLGPDASVRDFHLDHGLRVLRGQARVFVSSNGPLASSVFMASWF